MATGQPSCSLQPSPCRVSVLPLFILNQRFPFLIFQGRDASASFFPFLLPKWTGTFFFFFKCLAAPGLSCSTQDPHASLWRVVSLAEACKHLVVACGIKFPNQGSSPGPLPWEDGVLTTGLLGKSLGLEHYLKAPAWHCSLPAKELVSLLCCHLPVLPSLPQTPLPWAPSRCVRPLMLRTKTYVESQDVPRSYDS